MDKTAPDIVDVFPEPNATMVPLESTVEMLFSERMNNKSVEDAIFISPRSAELPEYKWKGRRLRIVFNEALRKERTYVLTIGTDAEDLRRNRLSRSFHLAFSTGEKLDAGRISGRVKSESGVEGIIVCAYGLNGEESLNPSEVYADYVTQCNSEGDFQLSYISPGIYRLFAIGDADRNLKYARGIESVGVTTRDVVISDSLKSVNGINFQMSIEDTVQPGIRSVINIDWSHLDVLFDEPVRFPDDSMSTPCFSIIEEKTIEDSVPVHRVYVNSIDAARIHLKTATMKADTSYLLQAHRLTDAAGNPLDTSRVSYAFKVMSRPDTVGARLVSQSVKDAGVNLPLNSEIQLVFSEAMDTVSVEGQFHMQDSTGAKVDGSYRWRNPADVTFSPSALLRSKMKYSVRVNVDSVFDEAGNACLDSSIAFTFETLNQDTLTGISGLVIDEKPDARGKFYLEARQVSREKLSYNVVLDSTGAFHFDSMLPGIYLLGGYRDEDGNGNYSYGSVTPFHPAERFLFYPDSIKVRSRWPSEGEKLIFKK
ncbi:MAG: Ig-like domain-containing protein [candidate division KSB1 bacterium]|nr:Ig-like domain-containing protein [candidate division KSB1 bacterium]